ncbi:MAG: hypothetical protein QXW98_04645 [Candidatus Caldarchaeum sp.]
MVILSESPEEIRRKIFIARMLQEKALPALKKEIARLEEAITNRIAMIEQLKRSLIDEINVMRDQMNAIAGEMNREIYGRPSYARKDIPVAGRTEIVSGITAEVKTGDMIRYERLPLAPITYYSMILRRYVSIDEVREVLSRMKEQINSIYHTVERYNAQLKPLQERYLTITLSYPDRVKPAALRELLAEIEQLYGDVYRLYTRRRARLR